MFDKKKINKVLLFIPPAYTSKDNLDINPLPPLGLAYLGAVLEAQGIDVKIVDCLVEGWTVREDCGGNVIRIGLPFREIEKIIRNYAPDLVGVNNLFTRQRVNAHEIYALAKKVDSSVITVAGGAHPTVMPDLVMADPNVDFVVLGEGEKTIVDLVAAVEGDKAISSLDGVAYRDEGMVKILPKTEFIVDLDEIPFPARHLLNMEKYFGLKASHGERKKHRFTPIITSRGCPADCTFCSANKVWGKKFRYRSAENVIAEMKQIKDEFLIEELMFEDDNVTLNINRAERIFDMMIAEKLEFSWDTPNGVAIFALNEQLITKMKASGCYKLNLAVETGNQQVMDNIIRKPVKLDRIKPLVDHARSIGLDVGLFFVIGMPGETEAQIWDSFHFARALGVYTPHFSIATPYPGSALYDLCVANNYIPKNYSLDMLFIRSFSITTEDWDGQRIKEIFRKGQNYLILSYFKDHPIKFCRDVLFKLLHEPVRLLSNAYKFVLAR